MIDLDRMLGKLLSGQGRSALGGAALGGLVTSLLTSGRGRRVGVSAAKYGGLAALGALAYHVYQQAAGKSAPAAPPRPDAPLEPPPAGSLPATPQAREAQAALLLRAMIAAVHADGEMDPKETRRLFDALQEVELEPAEKGHLLELMNRPPRLEEIAGTVARGSEGAAQVYLASLMAIDLDHPVEQAYLARLAVALGLNAEVVAGLHRDAGAPEPRPL